MVDTQPHDPPSAPPITSTPRPEGARPALDTIRSLLDGGQVEKALHVARRWDDDHDIRNAIGVCYLRMGNVEKAIGLFRGLTLACGGVYLKSDIPDKYKVNFAAALLLSGNVSGCTSILDELKDRQCPAAMQLREAIDDWKKSLSLWQRLSLVLGGQMKHPIRLGFPPGEV